MIRLILTVLFMLSVVIAGVLTVFAREHVLTAPLQWAAGVLLVIFLADRIFGLFKPQRGTGIPTSQIAEIERLYFRCMRDMLNEQPDFNQVINDLQRILAIDPRYKNARHFLNRALVLQAQPSSNGSHPTNKTRNRAEFKRLQEQLIDPDPAVRKAVVMEFIQYGPEAIDPIIALLMDEDSDVRVHAATALGWIGGKDAVQPLLVALVDSDTYVRRYAARALCWVVDTTALEGLMEALKDPDAYVRQYAARALGWSQDERAIRPLVELMAVEQNLDVQNYIHTALEDLGQKNARVERPVLVEE
jgi:hypothetical protein